MEKVLKNVKVAILVADGFEQVEMTEPKNALDNANAETHIVSLKTGKVKGWKNGNWGDEFTVDKSIDTVRSADYDALVLPGGVMSPDKLRANQDVINLIKDFFEAGKPIAAICHGPWLLAEAGVVKGLRVTSYGSIKTDMKNAGGHWVDEEVAVDRGVVTSRQPSDLPAFNKKMIEEFVEGIHSRKMVRSL
jgi:protease I